MGLNKPMSGTKVKLSEELKKYKRIKNQKNGLKYLLAM